eukprot:TRINITY_DN3683_c0_g1_i1.p1 TRINITY_DN3683_c0_g1~~TRINITY_DN3683_c0_g1_i1.p1  ORF type:complete len:355 (-),score=59.64 TRINITY_DN3683_c0_g1_i1:1865-2929(-)
MAANGGEVVLLNTQLQGNNATNGGAIALFSKASASLNNCTFVGNQAIQQGGAIYQDTDAEAHITGTSFEGHVASQGGAIYSSGVLAVSASNFIRNVAGSGGDIFSGEVNADPDDNSLTGVYVSDCTFAEGGATNANDTGDGNGGALNVDSWPDQERCLLDVQRSTFRGYTLTGGGVILTKCSTTVSGCTFEDSIADNAAGLRSQGQIGNVTVKDTTFRNLTSNYGAAVFVDQGMEVYFVGCLFEDNHATVNAGGAIVGSDNTRTSAMNCTFINCSAELKGGAYWASPGATITLDGCTFYNNKSMLWWLRRGPMQIANMQVLFVGCNDAARVTNFHASEWPRYSAKIVSAALLCT